jgi:hypothetical protein
MTSQMSVKKSPLPPFIKGESVSGRRIFSAAEAINWHLSLTQFISALFQASSIASGTISIHSNSLPIPNFKKLIPILPAPQYKSNIFHLISHTLCAAVPKSFSAPCVFVWKNENGDILNFEETISSDSSFWKLNFS